MFMKNRKLAFIVSLVILLPLLVGTLAGCSGGAPANQPTSASTAAVRNTDSKAAPAASSSNEQIKIAFTWWGDTKRHEIYNKICDMFEAANPNVKIDRPFGSWAEYWNKLATQVAGGNAPDVVGMHQDYVSDYAPRGALLELQQFVDSKVIDLSKVPDSVKKGGYVNGKLYMVAQGVVTTGMFYNTAVFDKLGVEYPKMDWTWEDFAKKVVEVKKAADAKGMKMWGAGDDSGSLVAPFHYWVRSNGQTLFTEDGKIGFTQDVVESWFTFWKNLRDQGAVPDAATVVEYSKLPLEQSLFATQKDAIATVPANQIWLYQNQVKDGGTINIVRIPHLDGKANGEYVEGSFLSITSKTKQPEVAAKFISFFINNTDAQKTFKLEQGVPPTTSALDAISNDLTPPQKRTTEFVSTTLKIAGNAPYAPTGVSEIRSRFSEIAQAVAYGKSTPKQGAQEVIKMCNDVLARNKK